MNQLDLSFTQAYSIATASYDCLELVLIGCGGTGSWLAPTITRLAWIIQESGKQVHICFADPDTIESVNIPRQNFCNAEVGANKAKALALRYSLTWGLDIAAVPERFTTQMVQHRYRTLTLLIGCVDNAAGRSIISSTLDSNSDNQAPQVWWLDCGNGENGGQVLLGSAVRSEQMHIAFPKPRGNIALSLCMALPAPSVQHPELLVPLPEEQSEHHLSCAQLAVRNAQSLSINQRVAVEASDYLLRLLVNKNLQRFATYFDMASGSCKSRYIVPKEVEAIFISE